MLISACGAVALEGAAGLPGDSSVEQSKEINDASGQQETGVESPNNVEGPANITESQNSEETDTNLNLGPNPEDFPAGYNPLTGLPVDDPALLNLRPVFISISHFPPNATRPPTGLSFAPWVFEMFTGEGQTRLFSLFYGDYPEQINTETGVDVRVEGVRSGRVFYEDIRQYFSACMVTGGADAQVAAQLTTCAHAFTNDPNDIGKGGLSIARLKEIAEQSAAANGQPNLSGNLFTTLPPEGGQAANSFLMFYNYLNQTLWEYDAEAGGYLRYQNSIEIPEEFTLSVDRLTGEPLVRENVIVLFAQHHVLNSTGTIIELDLTYTRGPAVLFRDGQAYRIYWDTTNGDYEQETGRLRPIRFTDASGAPIALKPGTMWLNVVDVTTELWETAVGEWKARFYEPLFGN
jgi:hypothetical protein